MSGTAEGTSRRFDLALWSGVSEDRAGTEQRSEGLVGVSAGYVRSRKRLAVTASLTGRARVDAAAATWKSEQAGVANLTFGFSRQTSLKVVQFVSHAHLDPFSLTRSLSVPAPGEDTRSWLENRLSTRLALTSLTTTELMHTLSRRSSVALTQRVVFWDTGIGSAVVENGARFDYRLSPGANLRVGYQLRGAGFWPVGGYGLVTHDIDVGYARSLVSPHTTVRFGTGSSVVDEGGEQTLRMLATAELAHVFNRRWAVTLAYGRPVQYLEGVGTPVLSDRVDVRVDGQVGRRSRIQLVSGYSVGTEAMAVGKGMSSYAGSIGWSSRVNPRMGLQAAAFVGRSNFDAGVVLPQGVPHRVAHVGLRASATYSFFASSGLR